MKCFDPLKAPYKSQVLAEATSLVYAQMNFCIEGGCSPNGATKHDLVRDVSGNEKSAGGGWLSPAALTS